jgi:hypothetical protein
MPPHLPSPLPSSDRNLLRVVERVVPHSEREEWSRVWQAELWHAHHRSRNGRRATASAAADLSLGLIRDALWLRTESWRRVLSGTAALCLGSLLSLLLVSTLLALALNGDWHSMDVKFAGQFLRFLFEAPIVVLVNIAIAPRIHIERSSRSSPSTNSSYWLTRQLFLTAKMALSLLIAFVLSADLTQPIGALSPIVGDLLQILLFTLLALVGLRWVFRDQDQRCKQCLRSLALPSRIGRPSHNLLEWNGTELACKRGHGLLSVPEMETSWCQSSQWIALDPA